MKKSLHITTTIDQPTILENMVEKLAHRRYELGFSKLIMPDNREALEPSSTETYVSGTVGIESENEQLAIPFITCFLFTCIKGKMGNYKLEWSSSLS